jgi:hypothetical protein
MTLFRLAPHSLALVGAITLFQLAGQSGRADAATLTLVEPSQKLCQLTGDTDWTTGHPTAALTDFHAHLTAVDLGFPVDGGPGKPLYFLFGDAFPGTTTDTNMPSDAIGFTTSTNKPFKRSCFHLELVKQGGTFAHPTVSPWIPQGAFNVPTGGVYVDNKLYAFFWTDHCAALPSIPLEANSETPLKLPAAYQDCPQTRQLNIIGRSVLASASETAPAAFEREHPLGPITRLPSDLAGMPSGFVYVTAAPPGHVRVPRELGPTMPGQKPKAFVPVFGVARYRLSIPYLALAPQDTFADPATWMFYAGQSSGGAPKFVTRAEWENGHDATGEWMPPKGAELYAGGVIDNVDEHCVGEHSVTYNSALRTWLLVYNCGPRVEARTAPDPWGPWSAPTKLISMFDPAVVCMLIMNGMTGCGPSKSNFWQFTGQNPPGFFYAPFPMERFTEDLTPADAVGTRTAKIYWLVSTWNPYQVIVMESKLQITTN